MTNTPKHTPGPWKAYSLKDTSGQWFVEGPDVEICCVSGAGYDNKANAQLIAAAPEMLALLERINYAFYVKNSSKALREVMAETKPLLQKARGGIVDSPDDEV